MYTGRDFDPADTHESELYCFDFTNDIRSGDTVVSAVFECRVSTRSKVGDADASSRLKDSAIIQTPRAYHRLEGLLPGVIYRIQATATTSLGDKVTLHSYVQVGPDEGAVA